MNNPNYAPLVCTFHSQGVKGVGQSLRYRPCHRCIARMAVEVVSCLLFKFSLASALWIPVPLCRAGGSTTEKALK